MIKLGITGGIGAGKSHVCDILHQSHYPIFDMDSRAAIIMNTTLVSDQLKKEFGDNIYKGSLDRKLLASIVFNDQSKLDKLNAIVHPHVMEHFHAWAEVQDSDVVVAESAIIFEHGLESEFDYVAVVVAPDDVRIQRVIERDDVTEEMVAARMDKQMSQDEKVELADFVISNWDGGRQLEYQLDTLFSLILKK